MNSPLPNSGESGSFQAVHLFRAISSGFSLYSVLSALPLSHVAQDLGTVLGDVLWTYNHDPESSFLYV